MRKLNQPNRAQRKRERLNPWKIIHINSNCSIFSVCVWIKQDSWEDEEEEAKEDEKSDETEVVRKAKPQKNLTKKIAEREVSPPKTPKISTRITTLNFFIT